MSKGAPFTRAPISQAPARLDENCSDRLRRSIDCRFQRVRDPFNPDNANPDGQPLTWEEVYADWRSADLQYYWRKLPLTDVPFDPRWFDRRDALGLALGEAGDRARSVLQRIVARDPDPGKRERAARRLAALDPPRSSPAP